MQWNNDVYAKLIQDRSAGAVPFARAKPSKDLEGEVAMVVIKNDPHSVEQAKAVAKRIRQLLLQDPQAKIALLVRSRNKLPIFFTAMRREEVVWKGVDIETIIRRSGST